jgi:NADH-quinone oxidoreductase subunit C
MTQQQIHELLKARFGDAIGDWCIPENGDSWVDVDAERLTDVCRFLRDTLELRFDSLRLISGVDRGDILLSVYHLYSYVHFHDVTLRVRTPRMMPNMPSIADLWPAAEWHEREVYDMFGIVYEGHPALTRILLPGDWDGFPLRKDYETPKIYNGMTNE